MVELNYIIVCYISKLYYSRLSYLFCRHYLSSIVIAILFLFSLSIFYQLYCHLSNSQKCEVNTNSFVLFFLLDIYENNFFLDYYFLRGPILNFTYQLFQFIIYILQYLAERIMFLEHFGGCLSWPSLLLLALNLARNEAWVVPETFFFL